MTRDAWRPVVDGALRVRVLYNPVSMLVLRLGATLLVPFERDRYIYRDTQGEEVLLFEPEPVGGLVEVGLGVLLG
jgi:hypothetical protein